MKEKYIPSSEEVKKAEEMMTSKEKEMSEERESTFEAGANHQAEEEKTKEYERIAKIIEREDIKKKDKIMISYKGGHNPINVYFSYLGKTEIGYFENIGRDGKGNMSGHDKLNQIANIYKYETK